MFARMLKPLIVVLLSWMLAGPIGVGVLAFCYVVLRPFALESADKHGISTVAASRMGGSVIVLFLVATLLPQLLSSEAVSNTAFLVIVFVTMVLYLLGLAEDMGAKLPALIRLCAILLLVGFAFSALNLNQFDFSPWLDSAPVLTQFLGLCLLTIAAGFVINSFNTADGANGLIAGTAILFLVSALEQFGLQASLAPLWMSAALGTGLFFIVNVLVGRFFLGDGGAYALGGIVVLTLWSALQNQPNAVLPLLCLVLYPIVDLSFSAVRRLLTGRSPMAADNRHLHNLLYRYFRRSLSSGVANSVTGLAIVATFSGSGYLMSAAPVELLVLLIAAQVAVYSAFWWLLDTQSRLMEEGSHSTSQEQAA